MIICLNGPPKSGKTTAAKILESCGMEILDLSKPFREFIQNALGLTPHEMKIYKDSRILFETGVTIRSIQISIATEMERINPVIWVENAVRKAFYDRNYVLDSVGKVVQWEYLVKSGHELVLWRIDDEDNSKYKYYPNLFTDGRENIDITSVKNDISTMTIHNTHCTQRNDESLMAYKEKINGIYREIQKTQNKTN